MNLYIFNKTSQAAAFGIGTYIRELTNALRQSNINVCVVNLFSDKPQIHSEELDGIRYWYFPMSIRRQRTTDPKKRKELYYRNVVYFFQLHISDRKNLIFHLNYLDCKLLVDSLKTVFDCKTVLVVHYLDSIMILLGNISRLRRVISLTDELTNEEEKSAKESFQKEKEFLQSHAIDKIICLSHHTFDMFHQDYQIDKEKMAVIYNGLSDMTIKKTDIQFLREKWHVSSKEKIILFIGRINEAKGLIFLINAFREILKKDLNFRLMIVGNGSYDLYLQEAKNISTKITFTGLLEKKELYELYQISDIGVMPSLTEQCNYVAIEMMIHGLPMVTAAAPGLAEMTKSGVNSLQVPVIEHPNKMEIDTKLLAEKMLFLLEHPEETKRLGKNARKLYGEKFSEEIFRKNMLNFYHSLYE